MFKLSRIFTLASVPLAALLPAATYASCLTNANVLNFGAVPNTGIDATPAIQNAINATCSGGYVYIPAGKYTLLSSGGVSGVYQNGSPVKTALKITRSVHLYGDTAPLSNTDTGKSILFLGSQTRMRMLSIEAGSVLIQSLTFDGNKLQRFSAGSDYGSPSSGRVVDSLINTTAGSSWISVNQCEIRNGLEDGIGFANSSNVSVTNSRLHGLGYYKLNTDNGASAISLYGATNATIQGNTITGNSIGIWANYGSQSIVITGNTITNNPKGAMSIGALPNDRTGYNPLSPVQNVSITKNTLTGNGYPTDAAPPAESGQATIGILSVGTGNIAENVVSGNKGPGIFIQGTSASNGTPGVPSSNWTATLNYIQNNQGIGAHYAGPNVNMTLRWNVITHNGTFIGHQVVNPETPLNSDYLINNQISY